MPFGEDRHHQEEIEQLLRFGVYQLERIADALQKPSANGSALTITGDPMATVTQSFFADFPSDSVPAAPPIGNLATFASSNDAVATVDSSGVVTDVSSGTVEISCANSGGTNPDGSAYAGADPTPVSYTTTIAALAANGSTLSIA